MKRIILLVLLLGLSINIFASNFIEVDKDYILFVTSASKEDMKSKTFANIKPKGATNGVLMKYTKDLTQCTMNVFGGAGEVSLLDVVKDKNGDFVVVGVADEKSIGTGDLKNVKGFGEKDVILVRFDKNLKIKDVQTFGSKANDFSSQILINKKGDFVICGKSIHEDGQTCAFIAMLDSKFKVKNVTEFSGSFKEKEDADWTDFTKAIECKDTSYTIIGKTIKGNVEKSIVVKTNKNLVIYDKKSFGEKVNNVTFTDIYETPKKDFYLVGYSGGEKQCGCLLELNKAIELVSFTEFMPVFNKEICNSNVILSIEPLKRIKSYMISGVCQFGGESMNYYAVFKPGEKLSEIVPFDERGGLNHLVCEDTSFYIIGYKENKIVPEEIGWF